MAEFDVVVATSGLDEKLTRLEREQLPFARSLAANQAAFETMGTLRKTAQLTLDRPTRFTISGIRYERGTKRHPVSSVYLSGDAGKGTAPAKYLTVAYGGVRGQRPSERVLERAGLISPGEGWVPAAVRLNRYGNVAASRIVHILSSIRAFGEQGFQANVTGRSRARGKKRGRAQYFVSRGTNRRLPRGVYERYGRKKSKVRPVLLFVDLPSYSVQFDFRAIAQREARRRYVAAWPEALRRALRTARR